MNVEFLLELKWGKGGLFNQLNNKLTWNEYRERKKKGCSSKRLFYF